MSKALVINVSERVEDIKKNIRSAKTDTQKKRLRILLAIKEAGDAGISKYDAAKQAKTAASNVQTWRTVYQKEGIAPFLEDARKGFKPSGITAVRQFIDNQTKLLSDSIIKSTCFRKRLFLCNCRTDL